MTAARKPPGNIRVWCSACGTVRDTDPTRIPWCRHGDPRLTARRMQPIFAGHPLATGPLPFEEPD